MRAQGWIALLLVAASLAVFHRVRDHDFVGLDDHRYVVANAHLREGPLKTRTAEIGMWIRASEAGTGLGTAVLTELVRWGFTDWPWLRLSWKCNAENLASARVAQKCGFVYEGQIRGEYDEVMSVLNAELKTTFEAEPKAIFVIKILNNPIAD